MTPPDTLAAIAARWQQHIPTRPPGPDADSPDLYAAADRAELEAIRVRQAANRQAAYLRHLPSHYATAAYDTLRPAQNPNRQISTWYERGPRTLVIVGPPRVGKTTAAYAIANHAARQLDWVMARTAANLSAALKPGADENAYDHATACGLLVVDDLGREKPTEWWLEQLQRIVDARCADELRIVVTANTTPDAGRAYDELAAKYGDPIAERLIDDGGIVVVDGPAIRRVATSW